MQLIRPRFKHRQAKGAHDAVALCSLLNKYYRRAVNGIASASSAMTVQEHWTPLSLAMDRTKMCTARLATARTGVHMVTDSPVVPVSYKLTV